MTFGRVPRSRLCPPSVRIPPMADEKAKPRFHFGIRTLLVLMALLAVLLSYGPHLYQWARSTHLDESVVDFNARQANWLKRSSVRRLTRTEVVRRIQREL